MRHLSFPGRPESSLTTASPHLCWTQMWSKVFPSSLSQPCSSWKRGHCSSTAWATTSNLFGKWYSCWYARSIRLFPLRSVAFNSWEDMAWTSSRAWCRERTPDGDSSCLVAAFEFFSAGKWYLLAPTKQTTSRAVTGLVTILPARLFRFFLFAGPFLAAFSLLSAPKYVMVPTSTCPDGSLMTSSSPLSSSSEKTTSSRSSSLINVFPQIGPLPPSSRPPLLPWRDRNSSIRRLYRVDASSPNSKRHVLWLRTSPVKSRADPTWWCCAPPPC
mmetsp:Transcript_15601/g.38635  ORF Transcript_15601/g.38635 Transcript_15601/m.38635 type:complete len:272 (-) Transcript_15601:1941-2756(-)